MMFVKWIYLCTIIHICVFTSALADENLKKSEAIDRSIITADNTTNTSTSSTEDVSPSNQIISPKKHILMFHPWGTRSHKYQLNALLLGLLKSGNAVTGVFAWKTDIVHQQYTEIVVKDGYVCKMNCGIP